MKNRINLKQIILFFIVLFPISLYSQNCNCDSVFLWTKNMFEQNDAGFQYVLEKKGEQAYKIHNQLIIEKVKDIKSPIECETVIRNWLSFFRKSHVEFHYTGEHEPENKEITKNSVNTLNIEITQTDSYQLHLKYLNATNPFLLQLDKNTLYFRVPSFNGNQKSKIDSVIVKNRTLLLTTKNLILDIRNGTGGNDNSYEELLPFLYTNPIRMPTVEFLSTSLNNQRMLDFSTNTGLALMFGLNSTKEEMKEFKIKYDTLSNHLGEFVNLNPYNVSITTFDTIYPYPKNIGILINKNNVSTDEQFILEAKQSKKVKLFGETTKGGLDFSNLNLVFTPNKEFVLVYTLTKSLRLPYMAVDDIGIKPDFFIDNEIPKYKWIDFVTKILNE